MLPREPDYENIASRDLKRKLDQDERPILLDVREPWEHATARIDGSKLIPTAEVPDRMLELDPEAETVVICHHGLRSAYVTRFLARSGFRKVINLEGGLDSYADVDPSVPRY